MAHTAAWRAGETDSLFTPLLFFSIFMSARYTIHPFANYNIAHFVTVMYWWEIYLGLPLYHRLTTRGAPPLRVQAGPPAFRGDIRPAVLVRWVGLAWVAWVVVIVVLLCMVGWLGTPAQGLLWLVAETVLLCVLGVALVFPAVKCVRCCTATVAPTDPYAWIGLPAGQT